ncbi:hypothetical protein COL5a_011298 [Colletotrichum fioriniae]|uniref:uncharacterized protein n=1 Tax=Colletotrichum fioriniae TaxID=710243 RepID=UPI0032DB2B80|nr:hypothetical protein COL5a_011298 [Colletotrichum fioriniae]KAJ3940750.1 hypothetical protein N0V96_009765 [Colletotrichum fioriniae]
MLYNELSTLSSGRRSKVQSAQISAFIKNLEGRLNNVIDKNSDPTAGPVHELASLLKSLILQKVQETSRPPQEQPEWGSEIITPKDNLFKWSVMTTEQNINAYRSNRHPEFHWFLKLLFQYDVLIFMIGQLSQRMTGAIVERAWQLVPSIYEFHPEFLDPSQEYNLVLARFTVKAWKTRDDYLSSQQGLRPEEPDYMKRIRQILGTSLDRCATGTVLPVPEDALSAESQIGQGSMEELFSTCLGAAAAWDSLAHPDEECIQRQLSTFEDLDMTVPRNW